MFAVIFGKSAGRIGHVSENVFSWPRHKGLSCLAGQQRLRDQPNQHEEKCQHHSFTVFTTYSIHFKKKKKKMQAHNWFSTLTPQPQRALWHQTNHRINKLYHVHIQWLHMSKIYRSFFKIYFLNQYKKVHIL